MASLFCKWILNSWEASLFCIGIGMSDSRFWGRLGPDWCKVFSHAPGLLGGFLHLRFVSILSIVVFWSSSNFQQLCPAHFEIADYPV